MQNFDFSEIQTNILSTSESDHPEDIDSEEDEDSFADTRNRIYMGFLNTIFVSSHMYAREPRRDPSNRRLNKHGIYIRHCQESNSQPVPRTFPTSFEAIFCSLDQGRHLRGAGGGGGKEKEKKKERKEEREKSKEKKERKMGSMNNVKLLVHIKWCFSNF